VTATGEWLPFLGGRWFALDLPRYGPCRRASLFQVAAVRLGPAERRGRGRRQFRSRQGAGAGYQAVHEVLCTDVVAPK